MSILRLHEITFECVGHGHCPTLKVVAEDVESAIAACRPIVAKKHMVPVEHKVASENTVTYVDLIAPNAQGHVRPCSEAEGA